MSKITKITTQKKSTNRYNIFINEAYAFSVDEDTLIKEHLHKGQLLTEEDISRIQQTETRQQAYLLGVNYISYRMRSCKELYHYLQKKEVDPVMIDRTMERLIHEKLLDDEMFANAFVKDRILLTSKGPNVIKKELMEKGVSPSIIEKVLQQYTREIQFKKVYKFAEKEFRKKSKHPYKKRKEQITLTLLRKGFSNDVIVDAIAEIPVEMDDEIENEKLAKQGEKLYRKLEKKYEGYELKERLKASLYQKGFPMERIHKFVENKCDCM
ncbi:recombination regulator RecX [Pseudogracilibacillus sp. ICA-222130]|uniref:recombination regulator RecX n=1 Tax=Pseudogracilibacillus sp. ICA-222130 TaxID=3134655 RepID=UPI0030C6524A